ncbi:MAG TPA: DUF1674 domain-containing protein [Azospirillaceae bacterium]|nr:DUF1674 domain-containing protein [Azospirillaceae bacterium]
MSKQPADAHPAGPAAPKPEPGAKPVPVPQPPGEIGGPAGPEPTRFGDWEQKGRCSDF